MQGSFEEMDGPCIIVIGAVVLFAERVGDEPALEGGAAVPCPGVGAGDGEVVDNAAIIKKQTPFVIIRQYLYICV